MLNYNTVYTSVWSLRLACSRASFQITLLFPVGAFHGMVFTVPLRYAWFCHQSGPAPEVFVLLL